MSPPEHVIWHDLECGGYRADLRLWRRMADDSGDPVLDVGAGCGRVSIDLAGHGHRVVALDLDADLLEELSRRAQAVLGDGGSLLSAVQGDARDFDLGQQRFALCIVPMQTIQLLGGPAARRAFLDRACHHLIPGGVLAIAIAPEFDEFAWQEGDSGPLPDIVELEGTIYASQPTAVRVEGESVALERQREVIDPHGGRRVTQDRIDLDLLSAARLIADGASAGLRPVGTHTIGETDEHVGSLVVIFRA